MHINSWRCSAMIMLMLTCCALRFLALTRRAFSAGDLSLNETRFVRPAGGLPSRVTCRVYGLWSRALGSRVAINCHEREGW